MSTPTIQSTAWQKFRAGMLAQAEADNQPCWICRRPIDYSLRGTNRNAPTLDHLAPRFAGGDLLDPGNVAVAPFGCNSRRGAAQRNAAGKSRPSRAW